MRYGLYVTECNIFDDNDLYFIGTYDECYAYYAYEEKWHHLGYCYIEPLED